MSRVDLGIDGPLARLHLNNPAKLNAFTPDMLHALEAHCDAIEADVSIRGVIVTAEGDRAFCAGADIIGWGALSPTDFARNWVRLGHRVFDRLARLSRPTVAVIQGHAFGGGLELALCADIVLVAEHATFALPEIRSGTVADAASIKLPKRIPYHIAMELLLTGRWFDAEEAARWGLVNRVVPGAELMDAARKMADDLASGPPLVFAAIKEIVREAEAMKFNDALNRITRSQFETVERLYRSEDQQEGARAFAEGRDPVWKGT